MKISFKYFKNFSKRTEINLSNFNVVIGPNSSGKTSLSQAITHYVNLLNNKFRSSSTSMFHDLTSRMLYNKETLKKSKNNDQLLAFNSQIDNTPFDLDFLYLEKHLNLLPNDLIDNNSFEKNVAPSKIIMSYPLHVDSRGELIEQEISILRQDISSIFKDYEEEGSNSLKFELGNIFNSYYSEYIKELKKSSNTINSLDVGYKQNSIVNVVNGASFLDGLTITVNKNNPSESFIYHRDGSEMRNNIKKLVNDCAKLVFKNEFDRMDNIFNTYINSLKNYKKHSISEPIEIDFSKVKNFTDIIYRDDNDLNYNSLLFENNFWNQSPYVSTYFSKKGHFKEVYNNDYLKNLFKGRIRSFGHQSRRKYLASRTEFNTLSDLGFDYDFQYNRIQNLYRFSDVNSFFENEQVYNSPEIYSHFNKKSVNEIVANKYPPSRGFQFDIGSHDNSEENSVDYSKFLVNAKFYPIIKKYFSDSEEDNLQFSKFFLNSDINLKKNPGSTTSYAIEYASEFKRILDDYVLDKEVYFKTHSNWIKTRAQSFGVTAKIYKHQIHLFEMYFMRQALIQFKKNMYRHIYNEYLTSLGTMIFRLLNDDNEHNPISPITRSVILHPFKDNNANRDKKLLYNEQEIDNLFNGLYYATITKKYGHKVYLGNDEKNEIEEMCSFINKNLKKMSINFRINIESVVKKTNVNPLKTGNYLVSVIEHNRKEEDDFQLIPLSECGMGNSQLIGILGSIYLLTEQFENTRIKRGRTIDNLEQYIIIVREPESYLHPKWAGELTEYLYNFAKENSNVKIVIETHSEVILRKTQVLTKNDNHDKDQLFSKAFYVKKVNSRGQSNSKIIDLGLKPNGFLQKTIDPGFFDTNTDLVYELWKPKKK
jgi:energy-coupling factor transporter ATP-binding protein EcfA2